MAEVEDEADDIRGDEPSDGAAGVHADDDPAAGAEREPGRLDEPRIVVDERAGRIGDRRSVGAVTYRELQAMLGDQLLSGGGAAVSCQSCPVSGVGWGGPYLQEWRPSPQTPGAEVGLYDHGGEWHG